MSGDSVQPILAAALATLILLCVAGWLMTRAAREHQLHQELTAQRRRLSAQHSAITQLIEIQSTAEFPQYVAELTKSVARTLTLKRASVWRMNDQGTILESLCTYDGGPNLQGGGQGLLAATYPRYFAALMTGRVITADDAVQDTRTAELAADYLIPAGITSMMNVPFRIVGGARGVMFFEHGGSPRRWNPDDQTFALASANLVALAYEKAERRLAQAAVKRSEERYRALFQSSRDAIMTLAPPSWKFTSGNIATLKMFGVRTTAAFVELGPWDLSPEMQPDGQLSPVKARDMIAIAMRETSHTFEWTHKRLCGECFPAIVVLARMTHGGDVFLQASVRDVSPQKKAEEELQASEQRLNLAAESAGLSLFDWDIAGDTIYLDAQWNKMLGGSAESKRIDGATFAAMVLPEDLPPLRAHLIEVLKERTERYRFEHRVRTASGQWQWVQSHGAVISRDAQGRALRMVGFNADISARKRSEAEIRDMNLVLTAKAEQLAAVSHELEAFSYSVSHDLRAPLRSILGFGELLMRKSLDQLDAEGQARMRRILAAATRMGQLIDDLLKLAKISRQSLAVRKVDMHAMAAEMFAELRETSPQRQVEVVIAPDLTVEADSGLMRVVLANLIGNAWKFTATRAASRIEFGSTIIDGERTFFVRDNGAGFDMAYAGRLFTPFQRLHTQQQFEGTGIGLAAVKRIVERHLGRVWVESAVEKGTSAFFTIGAAGLSGAVGRLRLDASR